MIETMKKALKYAIAKSENPTKIKEYMEEYFSTIEGDRRYKLKWRALSGNHKYTFSGLFDYHGRAYYFNNVGGKITLEYYNR